MTKLDSWRKWENGWRKQGHDMPGATLHYVSDSIAVFKIPGHKWWSSIGERTYAPASFEVVLIKAKTAEGDRIKGVTLADFDIRAKD